jgi:hypothetical protein
MNRKRKKGEMRHPRPSRYCFQSVFTDLPTHCLLKDHNSQDWLLCFFQQVKVGGIIIGPEHINKWTQAGKLHEVDTTNEVEYAKFLLEVS